MNDNLLDKLERENLKIASFQKRVLAYIIDNIILSLIVFIIFYDQFSVVKSQIDVLNILKNFYIGFILLQISYHVIFTYMYGASLGKMACKIIIIDDELLDKPNFSKSLLRSSVRQLSDMTFMLGFAWALGNVYCKTWEDYLSRTIVVDAS